MLYYSNSNNNIIDMITVNSIVKLPPIISTSKCLRRPSMPTINSLHIISIHLSMYNLFHLSVSPNSLQRTGMIYSTFLIHHEWIGANVNVGLCFAARSKSHSDLDLVLILLLYLSVVLSIRQTVPAINVVRDPLTVTKLT